MMDIFSFLLNNFVISKDKKWLVIIKFNKINDHDLGTGIKSDFEFNVFAYFGLFRSL